MAQQYGQVSSYLNRSVKTKVACKNTRYVSKIAVTHKLSVNRTLLGVLGRRVPVVAEEQLVTATTGGDHCHR